MDKISKHKLREKLTEKFKESNSAIVAEYRGMKVGELTELRSILRKSGAEFKVLKNRVAKKAAEGSEISILQGDLKGPSGIIILRGDAAAGTKAAFEFQKDHPNFIVKAGLLDRQRLTTAQLKVVAELPSKEVLLARIIGTLVAPHRSLLGVLSGVPRQLVTVLNAIKDKKAQG